MTVDVLPNGPLDRCTGQSATFTLSIVGGTAPYAYQWTKNGFDIPSANASSLLLSGLTLGNEGTYNCKVTDATLTYVDVVDASGTFLDVEQPAQVLTSPTGSTICVGTTVSLTATYAGDPAPTVTWRKGGSPIANGATGNGSTYAITSGSGTTTLQILNAQSADAGSFDAVVSNQCGAGTFTETSDAAVLAADTTFPTFTNCGDVTIFTNPGLCTATFNFTPAATDNCGVASISGPVSASLAAGAVYPYAFSATDTAGNTTNCTMNVTVVDGEAPILSVPAAPVFVANATTPLVVTFSVSATDNCGALVVCTPPSGSVFPAGRTTVNCSASDGVNTVNGSFDVFVCDTNPAPMTVWVDDNWVGFPNGTDVGMSRTVGCDAFATIQAGVNAVAVGGAVQVAAGTYDEDVTISGKTLQLLGTGNPTIRGVSGGSSATVFVVSSPNVEIAGFTITRNGNALATWNDPNLNNNGLLASSSPNLLFRDNVVTGNRNGLNLQFMTGAVLRNNTVDNNRTGMQMVDNVTGATVTENRFTNNWTMGVLFRDEGPGSDTTGTSFYNNDISGNWYAQIEYRLGGPTSTAKNFSGNWLGTTTPTVVATNGGEPGYSGQIPTVFGGMSTPPVAPQPHVKGDGSSYFDVTPLLASGADTDVDGGNGTNGFQGDFSTVSVTTIVGQTGSAGRVQEGATVVTTGGLVQVQAGTYVENCTVPKRCTIDGAGSGGNGAANPAVHTIVQAASASSPAIALGAGGANASDRLVISDLRTVGATNSDGVAVATTPCSHVTLLRVTSTGNGDGVEIGFAGGTASDFDLDDCVLSNSGGAGLRVASATTSTTDVDVLGGEMTGNNTHGFAFNQSLSATCFGDGFSFDGTTFTNNGSIIAGNGTGHLSFFGFNGSAELRNLTLSGTAYVPVQFRGLSPAAPLGAVVFDNVAISGTTPRPGVYMQVYTDISGVSLSGLNLAGMASSNAPGGFFSTAGMILDHTGPALALNDTVFPCQGVGYFGLTLGNSGGASAVCATTFVGATTLAQKEACVLDTAEAAPLGDVTFQDVTFPGPPVGGTVCEGQPFAFSATPGGLGPFSYQWRKGGVDLFGETGPSYTIAAAALGDAGSYDVVVTGACGPETSPAAVLAVTPLPVAPASASASPATVCFGVGGTVTLTALGGSGATLEWFDDSCGGNLIGTGNGLVVAAPTVDTTYFARWNDVCGVSACASTTVTVQPGATASAGGPYVACYTAAAALSGSATNYVSVAWTTSGTGSFTNPTGLVTDYVPSLADATAGTVTVTLTATPIAPCVAPAVSNATVTISGAPAVVYVDDSYVGLLPGTSVDFPLGGGGPTHTIGCDAFATINAAVAAVPAGGTVNVAGGTYAEDVVIGKTLSILGAGSATTTVVGPIGGDGAGFRFNANGIVVDGFAVTRAGNNTTDWNNPGLNSAGVAIQSRTSGTVRNCFIYGNRTGIDVNNSTGIVLRNNRIDDNRTGLIFRNVTDDCVVEENSIADNWTVGVLFLDASGGTNSPLQTALNCSFFGNDISGNWYGQIVDRQSGGSLPLPGANLKNFSGNWLGTTTPVVSAANSAEPGYAAQIPVAYGGMAVPPVVPEPDVLGPASANFDITPMLSSGVDTNFDFGNGTHGFQGDFSGVTVTAAVAQTGAAGRVQEGATVVTTGGLVQVQAGTFVENCTVPKRCTIDGAGSGGNGAANPALHTIVSAANPSAPAISLGACGFDSSNRVVISDLRTTGATGSSGVATATTPCAHVTLERVTSTGNTNGVHFGVASGVADDFALTDCVLNGNANAGVRVASATVSFTGLVVSGGEISSNAYMGFSFNPSGLATCFGDDVTFDGVAMANNGNPATSGTGHLSFFGYNGSAVLKDLTLTGTTRVPVQFRGLGTDGVPGTWSSCGAVSFDNVVVSGSSSRPGVYIQLYTDLSAVSLSGLNLSGNSSTNGPGGFFSNGGMALDHVGPPLALGDTSFPCQGTGYVGLAIANVGGAAATCATSFAGASTLAAKEACVLDGDDFVGLGDVTFQDVSFVSAPAGGTACEGTPFTFTVTAGGLGPFSYQWRKGGVDLFGEIGPSYSIASLVPGDAGSYDVVVTGACGPETSPAAVLMVTPLPVAPASASASPAAVCFGVGGTVTLNAVGGSGATLEWFDDSCGGNLIGTGDGLVIAAPLADTTYFARWTTACGMSGCASVAVDVQAPPTSAAGGPYATCDTDPVAIAGFATDAASTLWTTSGTGSFGDATSLATTYVPSPADVTAGTVTLTLTASATAPCAVAAVAHATLTVNASPTVTAPASQIACVGANASFSVVATGTGITYQWRKDGSDLFGETGPFLTVVGVTVASAGAYDIVITGLCDTVTSPAAYLTVLGPQGDDPCSAIEIVQSGTFAGNNTCSTPQGHLLPVGCGTGNHASNDVWYVFTAACDGTLTASTCPFTSSGVATFDSHLSAFSGPSPLLLSCPWGPGSGAFTQVACSDDAPGCFMWSTVSFPVTTGNTYYVRLAGATAAAFGPYVLDVDLDANLTLSWSQPLGPGSIELKNSGCEPGYLYYSAMTVDPANAGPGFGNGWFYGLHIGMPEIITEINWPGGAPFIGVLDANGESVWSLSGFGSFGGVVIYGVTLTFDPASGFKLACVSDVVQIGPLL